MFKQFHFEPIKTYLKNMPRDEWMLRRRLALFSETILKGYLYGDDGELQLQYTVPYTKSLGYIDFVRESVDEIEKKLSDYGILLYKEETQDKKYRALSMPEQINLQKPVDIPEKEKIREMGREVDPNGEDLCAWSFRMGVEKGIEHANKLKNSSL